MMLSKIIPLTLVVAWGLTSYATGDVISNNGDSWQRESSPDGVFNGDLISVWSTASPDGASRTGVLTFDLSGHSDPITRASLHLWSQANGFSDDAKPLIQSASILDPAGLPDGDSMTFNDVLGATVLAELEQLGRYNLAPVSSDASIQDRYLPSAASAADVAAIEAVRGSGSPTLVIALFAAEDGTDYGKSWGDGEFGGEDGFLATNGDAIPEPGAVLLLASGAVACWVARRR